MSDLQEKADKAWNRIDRSYRKGRNPYQPTTGKLMKDYDLSEAQVAVVKRKIRSIAADHNVLWGLAPAV